MAEKGRDNEELLVIVNANQTAITKVTKVLNTIDLGNKYS